MERVVWDNRFFAFLSLDCDGWIDHLIPIWLENGVNTMFPIEVGTWNASIAPWREKYGKKILGVGGMNKKTQPNFRVRLCFFGFHATIFKKNMQKKRSIYDTIG